MLPAGVKPDVADATRVGDVRYAAERLADAVMAVAYECVVFSKLLYLKNTVLKNIAFNDRKT